MSIKITRKAVGFNELQIGEMFLRREMVWFKESDAKIVSIDDRSIAAWKKDFDHQGTNKYLPVDQLIMEVK